MQVNFGHAWHGICQKLLRNSRKFMINVQQYYPKQVLINIWTIELISSFFPQPLVGSIGAYRVLWSIIKPSAETNRINSVYGDLYVSSCLRMTCSKELVWVDGLQTLLSEWLRVLKVQLGFTISRALVITDSAGFLYIVCLRFLLPLWPLPLGFYWEKLLLTDTWIAINVTLHRDCSLTWISRIIRDAKNNRLWQ